MLGPWRPHALFQAWLEEQLRILLPRYVARIKFHATVLEKVYALDLDSFMELIKPRYSSTGRPALNQPELFRAVILASHYKDSISYLTTLKSG